MPQYRVITYGGMDGLLFEDLLVTFSSGHRFPLRVKQGDLVPVEIFDPLDIKKSLIVGSLGSYVRSGAIKVEFSDIETNKKKRNPREKKEIPVTPPQPQPSVETVQPVQQKSEETPKVQQAPTDLKDVNVIDDFFKLSFFNRLKFIQNCTDKGLLTELLSHPRMDSPQLKNNVSYRLEQI